MWEEGIGLLLMAGVISDMRKRMVSFFYLTVFTVIILAELLINTRLQWYECLGGGIVGMIFMIFSKLTEEQIGYGDSWTILNLGIYTGIWRILLLLSIAFSLSLVFVGVGLLCKKLNKNSRIPFFPFLFAGYIGAMVW